ncbi:MAG: GNAT family N-acetyltransferase [Cyanobacteria bacterium J06560_2]
MQFETERLRLRDWYPTEDARHAMDIYGDARVMNWIEPGTKDASIRQVQGRLQRYVDRAKRTTDGTRSWAVVQKDIGRVIGTVMLNELPDIEDVRQQHTPEPIEGGMSTKYIEIGWHFRPSSWGFGYATEAAFCIAQHGFSALGFSLLLGVTQPENRHSITAMEQLGMRYSGMTTRCYGGKALQLYLLTEKDFQLAKEKCLEG